LVKANYLLAEADYALIEIRLMLARVGISQQKKAAPLLERLYRKHYLQPLA